MNDTQSTASSTLQAAPKLDAGTYCVGDIAALLQSSVRHVWRLHDGGKMPPCVRVGRLVRWQKAVIDAWIAAGCMTPASAGRR